MTEHLIQLKMGHHPGVFAVEVLIGSELFSTGGDYDRAVTEYEARIQAEARQRWFGWGD